MKNILLSLGLLLIFSSRGQAQDLVACDMIVVKGDTFPYMTLPTVMVISKREFKDVKSMSRFFQTKLYVTQMWPIATAATNIFNEVLQELADVSSNRDQKKFLKQKEKELDIEFKDKLKNLNTAQSEVLMKLIARNTGHSVYDLIKEFKNPMSAFYWNNMGKLLGYDMKYEYDANDNRDLEFICQQLEETKAFDISSNR